MLASLHAYENRSQWGAPKSSPETTATFLDSRRAMQKSAAPVIFLPLALLPTSEPMPTMR